LSLYLALLVAPFFDVLERAFGCCQIENLQRFLVPVQLSI
jgi:hypothetical protein